ncbi:MAG: PIN domain-containing protein [Candidatus Kapabacteria bacterium]|nr:PIN domain-containing protein [Candidatus Kapabacteria bacterium]
MELVYLLDTNAIINLFRFEKTIFGIKYYFSIITELELLSYSEISKEETNHIKHYCNDNGRLVVDKEILEKTIELRKLYKMKLPDAIICGSAYRYDLVLVTDDKKLHGIKEIKTVEFQDFIKSGN